MVTDPDLQRLEEFVRREIAALKDHLGELSIERQRALEAALAASDRAREAALTSAEKAVLRAQADIEKRFDSVNEFRRTLSDQAAAFATRNEVAQRFAALEKDMRVMEKQLDNAAGATSGRGGSWTYLIQGVSLVGTLIAIYFATR